MHEIDLMLGLTYGTNQWVIQCVKTCNTSFWLMQTHNSISKHMFLIRGNLMTKNHYMKYKMLPFDSLMVHVRAIYYKCLDLKVNCILLTRK